MVLASTSAKVAQSAVPIGNLFANSCKEILDSVGDARVVLLGEATHGTEEFYEKRADITKALIEKKGFQLVLCESDFPPFFHLNRWINKRDENYASMTDKEKTQEALGAMKGLKDRFPVWMWYNESFKNFVLYLKDANMTRTEDRKINLLGLDIYSLFRSADEVIRYLDSVDPDTAMMARKLYGTLGSFKPDPSDYARAIASKKVPSQEKKVTEMLLEINKRELDYIQNVSNGNEYFSAQENSRIVKSAEEYYRKSYMGGHVTWNIRDNAMTDMIKNALKWQDKQSSDGKPAKCVVWAHNSHIGDASQTEYSLTGQLNVGKLVRERFGKENSFIVGFSTHYGTVRAAKEWNGKDFVMELNPSLKDSVGSILHDVSVSNEEKDFGLIFRSNSKTSQLTAAQNEAKQILSSSLIQRFVGVQYVKMTELQSHYSRCKISTQFDLVLHLDKTSALKPIETSKDPVRPGTLDYSKWSALDELEDDEVDL